MTAIRATFSLPSPRDGLRMALAGLAIAFLVGFALVQITPFALTIANSFKCDAAVFISAQEQVDGIFFRPSVDGYRKILDSQLPRWIFNTAFLSVAVTIPRLIFDSMAGYALARLRFPGNRALFFLILGTMMIPGVVLLLKQLGLLNTYQGYIIVLAADAFGILLMKQFFESILREIEEAAMVDGANRYVIFFRIVLPMATPALTALTIFGFQGNWNNFMDALIILGGDTTLYNLPLGLTVLRGSGLDLQYDLVLAGSVITTLPMAVIFFIFQRYFVEGISYTGLKG